MTNFSLTGDETISGILSQRISQGLGPSYPSGLFEVRGELYWYMLSLYKRVAGFILQQIGIGWPGGDETLLRTLSSLFGIFSIWAIYGLGKAVYNKEIGLLASSFFAFSPVLVSLSRYARMYSMWIFFLIITFYFFYRGKIWPGILCFAGSYFIHRGTLIFIPGIFIAIWMMKTPILRKISYLCGLGLVVSLIAMHLFHNPRLNICPVDADASNQAFIRPSIKGALFYGGVLMGMRRDYIKKDLGDIEKSKKFFDAGRLLICALFLAGLMRFKREDVLLYATFWTGLLLMSFFVTWKWERYLAGLYPLFLIGSARGCDILRRSPLITKYRLGPVLLAAVFLIGINPLGNTAVFEKKVNWAPDFRGAYGYIKEESQEGDVVVATEAAPALYYLGKIDYFSQEEDYMIFLYRDKEGRVRERYSGKGVLDSREKWQEVLEKNSRVWFVTDILKFPYKFSDDTAGLIYDDFNLIKNFYLVKIFKYEKGIEGGYWKRPEKEDYVPLEAKFYYYSADIRIRNADVAGGVEGFRMSRQINPYWLLPYWRLGEIYMKVGLLEEGIKEYEKAYEMGKDDPLAEKFLEDAKKAKN